MKVFRLFCVKKLGLFSYFIYLCPILLFIINIFKRLITYEVHSSINDYACFPEH